MNKDLQFNQEEFQKSTTELMNKIKEQCNGYTYLVIKTALLTFRDLIILKESEKK